MANVDLTLAEMTQLADAADILAKAYRAASLPEPAVDATMPSGVTRSTTVVREGNNWYGIYDASTPALIWGNRPADVGNSATGPTVAAVVDNMHVRNLKIRDCGQTFRQSATTTTGFKIENIDAENLYRLVEGDAGASMTNFEVRNISIVGLERSVVRLRGNSGPGLIVGVYADALGVSGDAFPVAFHFDETVHDITLDTCRVHNFTMPSVANVYRQGDGFSDEGGCSNMIYRNCYASGCTDGGWDIKSTNVLLEDCVADGNKRNFRFWGQGTATHITSINPTGAHISIHGAGSPSPCDMVIEHLVVRSNNQMPIILVDSAGSLHIESWDIQVPTGTPLYKVDVGGSTITWGAGQGSPPNVF